MVCRSLWKRQGDSTKERSSRLYVCVVKVWIKELKLFVKKIGRSYCDETVPLRQTVVDGHINCPEVVATVPNGIDGGYSPKFAVLIEVCGGQKGTQSERMEKMD